MKYAGKTVYIVVNEGEIIDVYEDGGTAWNIANGINDENTMDEVMEAGYECYSLVYLNQNPFSFSKLNKIQDTLI